MTSGNPAAHQLFVLSVYGLRKREYFGVVDVVASVFTQFTLLRRPHVFRHLRVLIWPERLVFAVVDPFNPVTKITRSNGNG